MPSRRRPPSVALPVLKARRTERRFHSFSRSSSVTYKRVPTKNRMPPDEVTLGTRSSERIPRSFRPLFDTRELESIDGVADAFTREDGLAPTARARHEMFVAELQDELDYDFKRDRCFPTSRAALKALKFALQHPLCVPHSDKLISELGYLKLTVSAGNRRVESNAAVPASRSSRRSIVKLSAEEERKVARLEKTLAILKRRVAALASFTDDANGKALNYNK